MTPRCNYCLCPNHDSCCPVCHYILSGRYFQARAMAKALNWECGPYCSFCKRRSAARCSWMTETPVSVEARTVEIGERISLKPGGAIYRVTDLVRVP